MTALANRALLSSSRMKSLYTHTTRHRASLLQRTAGNRGISSWCRALLRNAQLLRSPGLTPHYPAHGATRDRDTSSWPPATQPSGRVPLPPLLCH